MQLNNLSVPSNLVEIDESGGRWITRNGVHLFIKDNVVGIGQQDWKDKILNLAQGRSENAKAMTERANLSPTNKNHAQASDSHKDAADMWDTYAEGHLNRSPERIKGIRMKQYHKRMANKHRRLSTPK